MDNYTPNPYNAQSTQQNPPTNAYAGQSSSNGYPPAHTYAAPGGPAPAPADGAGFGLSLASLITGVLGFCIPGLICAIMGFSKARAAKRLGFSGGKTSASFAMGLIGIILNAFGLLLQIILIIVIATAGISALPSIEQASSSASSTSGRSVSTLSSGTFDGDGAKTVANDLKKTLVNDLNASKCDSSSVNVKGLRVESRRPSVDSDGRSCETVRGVTLIDYGGRTRETPYTVEYVQVDNSWYLYSYTLDSYDVFPAPFTPNIAITQGIYEPSERSAGGVPQNGGQSTPAPAPEPTGSSAVSGMYYCLADVPDTSPYPGVSIGTYDASISAAVYSDYSMDLGYYFEGGDSSGYLSVSLPVKVHDISLSESGSSCTASESAECVGTYSNQVGGGAVVTCTVLVTVDASISADGTMKGTVSQRLIDTNDSSGMYDPGSAFDVTFDFVAYRS